MMKDLQVTHINTFKPKSLHLSESAFGPANINDYLPAWNDIPEEFRRERSPWNQFVHRWFGLGVSTANLKPRAGVNKTAAIAHCSAIMQSWDPPHEHKIAGVAYLMSLWFEDPPSTQVKP